MAVSTLFSSYFLLWISVDDWRYIWICYVRIYQLNISLHHVQYTVQSDKAKQSALSRKDGYTWSSGCAYCFTDLCLINCMRSEWSGGNILPFASLWAPAQRRLIQYGTSESGKRARIACCECCAYQYTDFDSLTACNRNKALQIFYKCISFAYSSWYACTWCHAANVKRTRSIINKMSQNANGYKHQLI